MELGFVYDARIDETADGATELFDDVQVRNGSGWWLKAAGTIPLYRHPDGWFADLHGDVLYRSEEYDLSYDAWLSESVEIASSDTNGATESVTLWQYGRFAETVSLSELAASLEGRLGYRRGQTSVYAGLSAQAYSEVDIDADVVSAEGTFEMDMERSKSATVTTGATVPFAGLLWFAELEWGSAERIGVGCRRSF
jgi:hypothetical protein